MPAPQVVPTQYKTLYGELSFANQYAVNEKVVSLEQLRKNEAISGLYIKDFQGLIFTYDFHPVRERHAATMTLLDACCLLAR